MQQQQNATTTKCNNNKMQQQQQQNSTNNNNNNNNNQNVAGAGTNQHCNKNRACMTHNHRRPYFLFFGRSVSEILTPGVTAMRSFHWSRAAGTSDLNRSEPRR